jgi:hypothetical protein
LPANHDIELVTKEYFQICRAILQAADLDQGENG